MTQPMWEMTHSGVTAGNSHTEGLATDLGKVVHDDVQGMFLHVHGLDLVRCLQDLQAMITHVTQRPTPHK